MSDEQEFTMILMDYDEMNPDDTIGRCIIPIRDMELSKTTEYWLDIDMDAAISDAPETQSKVNHLHLHLHICLWLCLCIYLCNFLHH